jgi:hypothetical protein
VYADGTTQSFDVNPRTGTPAGQPTWRSPWRTGTAPGNGQDNHPVYVYVQMVTLDSTAKVVGVILPNVGQGIFGLEIG